MAVFRGFCRVLRGALVALVSCFASEVSFAVTINLDNNNNTPVSVQLTSDSNGVYRNGVQMTPVDPFVSGGDNPLSVLPINNGSYYFAGYYNVVQQSDQYAAPIGVQYINSYGELTLAGNTAGTGYNNDATWVAEYLTQKSAIKLDSSGADPAGHGSEFVYMNGSYNGSNGENVYLNAQYSNGNLVYGQLMTVGSNHIIVPSKNGRAFAGYYSEANGQGVKCLNYLGEITSDGLTVECSAAHKVWYAYWCPEGQAINEQTGECGCPTGYTETTGSSLELGEPTGGYYAYGQDGGESGDSGEIKDLLDENTNRSNVFGIVFSGGNNSLFGQAMCSHVPSNLGDSGLYSDLSNSSGDNCWCNLTGYSLDNDTIQSLQSDSWFFAEEISNDCEKYCADTCAKALSGSAGGGVELREAMLGSNYCIANQYEVRYYCDGDDNGEPNSEPVTTDTVYYNQSGYSFDSANNSLVAGCGQTGYHVDSYKCYNINTGLQVNDADVNPWHIASDVYCIPTWVPNVHSVNYNCNNGGLGTNSSAQNGFGTTVNIPQTAGSCVAPQGTDFNGWICSGVTMSSNNTFTMPDNDVTCTAGWLGNTFEITLEAHTGVGGVSPVSQNAGSMISNGTETIYAVTNYGAYLDNARVQQMTINQNPITLPVRTGYEFMGYGDSDNGVFVYDPDHVTLYIDANGYINSAGIALAQSANGDMFWYAIWKPRNYNITYYGCDGETFDDETGAGALTYDQYFSVPGISGTNLSLPEGQGFVRWNTHGNNISYYWPNQLYTWITDSNLDLYAVCKTLTYNVMYNCNSSDVNSVTPVDSNNYAMGATVSLPVGVNNTCVNSDYEFSGWVCTENDNPVTITSDSFSMPAADVTCTAQWASTVYLDWRLDGGSWAQDENENTLSNQPSCEYGTNTMGPVYKPVRTGYDFTGWTVTGHTDSPPGGGGT